MRSHQSLPDAQVIHFKALFAKANYIFADQAERQFAAKEICRFMSKPTDLALQALKRLGGYLKTHPRLVLNFPLHRASTIEVYSDTDWANKILAKRDAVINEDADGLQTEVVNEIKEKDSVDEAVEWLKFHKEKDWNEAAKKKERIEMGEVVKVDKDVDTEDEEVPDDPH